MEAKKSKFSFSFKVDRRDLGRRLRRYYPLYFFVALPLLYILVFQYGPMYGIQIAFKDYNPAIGMMNSPWVGFKHFINFFNGTMFWRLMYNTLILSLYSLIVGFPFPILLALMLNELRNARYKSVVQTVMYAPHFISMVVMVGIITTMLSPSIGVVNRIIGWFGVEPKYFMTMPSAFRHIYVWSGIWQNMGWSAIIYLAALSNVDPELHEAATVDGASRIARIININIPIILPTIIIMLIMRVGQLTSVGFEKVFLMRNDLNISVSEIISTYVYQRGLLNAQYSFSSAIGLFNNIINIIMLLMANKIAEKATETSLF